MPQWPGDGDGQGSVGKRQLKEKKMKSVISMFGIMVLCSLSTTEAAITYTDEAAFVTAIGTLEPIPKPALAEAVCIRDEGILET